MATPAGCLSLFKPFKNKPSIGILDKDEDSADVKCSLEQENIRFGKVSTDRCVSLDSNLPLTYRCQENHVGLYGGNQNEDGPYGDKKEVWMK